MTLKSCSPIVGVDVMSFDTEREVFLSWRVNISGQVAFVTFFSYTPIPDAKYDYNSTLNVFIPRKNCIFSLSLLPKT